MASSTHVAVVAVVGLLSVVVTTPASSLSFSVSFPLTRSYSETRADSLLTTFRDIVDSTDYFEQSQLDKAACSVPMLGNAQVTFGAREPKKKEGGTSSLPSEFVLTVNDATQDDFGWICTRFLECKSMFHDVCTEELNNVVTGHRRSQILISPGYDAAEASLAGSKVISDLFADESILVDLEKEGFVVIDTAPKVSAECNKKLSKFLVEKSSQDDSIRTDTVAFLARRDAVECGLDYHYDVLMGIASHLNDNIDFERRPYKPRLPGTRDKPLTNPAHIQAAEYRENDFYIAHKDNSLQTDGSFSNERHYTCILYCNDDWTAEDGGALRIYPGTAHIPHPEDDLFDEPYCDVLPKNGNLLIFDSKLVHSVEPVLQSAKPRRALTLWISRPEESGIRAKDSMYSKNGRSRAKEEDRDE